MISSFSWLLMIEHPQMRCLDYVEHRQAKTRPPSSFRSYLWWYPKFLRIS